MFIQLFTEALRALKVCVWKCRDEWPHRTLSEFRVFLFILDCTRTSVKFWHLFYLFEFFQSSSVRRVCAYRRGWGVRVRIFILFDSLAFAWLTTLSGSFKRFNLHRKGNVSAVPSPVKFALSRCRHQSPRIAWESAGWFQFIFVRKTTMSDKME